MKFDKFYRKSRYGKIKVNFLLPDHLKSHVYRISKSLYKKKGTSLRKITKVYEKNLAKYNINFSSETYFGVMTAISNRASQLGESLIGKENQSLSIWQASPMATYVEEWAIDFFLDKLNWDKNHSSGIFTSGGTASNELALLIARNSFIKKHFKRDAMYEGVHFKEFKKLIIFASKNSHFSIKRIAGLLGMGYNNVIEIECDTKNSLRIEDLKREIQVCIENGNIPFCIVATLGSTNFGSIDNIHKIHKIACDNNIWLHADAALGGALLLSENQNQLIKGIEFANSIAFDPQKWLHISQSCSLMFLKEKSLFDLINLPLKYHYREVEKTQYNMLNLGERTTQVAKRFDALKLWLSLMHYGEKNYGKMIEYTISLAKKFFHLLSNEECFQIQSEPMLNIVVFRFINDKIIDLNSLNEKIFWQMYKEQKVLFSQIEIDNDLYLRATFMNPLTKEKHLVKTIEYMKEIQNNYSNGAL